MGWGYVGEVGVHWGWGPEDQEVTIDEGSGGRGWASRIFLMKTGAQWWEASETMGKELQKI